MKKKSFIQKMSRIVIALLLVSTYNANACSTFKLQKGNRIVYGHNLNEGDIGVPGLIFINKRGIFKIGRTWSELTTKNKLNPSGFCWISKYGSVTFNTFAKDMPDGGMNETGLFIWEMNDETEYPKNDSLPKLNQMSWMQYILDNCSSLEEAINCASKFEIDGWGWHFFVGDANGNTAAISFIKGEVVIHYGDKMPIPALFNEPYERELELLKYYKGFGGFYEPVLDDPKVPRFVKTAVLIKNYNEKESIVDYGLKILEQIKVNDIPEWSVLFDVNEQKVYFKTRINPSVKNISMKDIDFSNKTAASILNMDIKDAGNVISQFHPFTNKNMRDFIRNDLLPILPEEFFTMGGITVDEYIQRMSTHADAASFNEKQFFCGVWKNQPQKEDDVVITIKLESKKDAITAGISNDKERKKFFEAQHLELNENKLKFTYKTPKNTMIEVLATITENAMKVDLNGIENSYGSYSLTRN